MRCHRPSLVLGFALFAGLCSVVLASLPAAACITSGCHQEETSGAVVHSPVEEHECRTCHLAADEDAETHQRNPEDFTDFTLATNDDGPICLDCHDDVKDSPHLHPPVADGECTACHSPHSSDQENLLTEASLPELCFSCHDPFEEGEHIHPPVEEGECTGCHSPHGGKQEKLLLAAPPQLCYSCHDDIADTMKLPGVHPPAEDGCLDCHRPHASENDTLLTAVSQPELCFSCHDPFEDGEHIHPPVEEGECTGCHSPHASRIEKLLVAMPPKLCLACHDDFEETLGKATVHKPVKTNCLICHRPHRSATEKLLVGGPVARLCLACHRKINPELAQSLKKAKVPHPPAEDGECLACHDPHASDNDKLQFRAGGALCGECHDEKVAEIKAADNLHPPVEEGECAGCHQVHGGERPALLAAPLATDFYNQYSRDTYGLCFRCHDPSLVEQRVVNDDETTFRDGSRNLHWVHVIKRGEKGRGCTICHDVHGSSQPFMLHPKVPFRGRRFSLKIQFTAADDGGTCVVGCHKPQTYHR